MVVIGEYLLGAIYVSRSTFNFYGVSFQVNGDVQAVFEHMQIFVSRTEQSFNLRADLDVLLHQGPVLASKKSAGCAFHVVKMRPPHLESVVPGRLHGSGKNR